MAHAKETVQTAPGFHHRSTGHEASSRPAPLTVANIGNKSVAVVSVSGAKRCLTGDREM